MNKKSAGMYGVYPTHAPYTYSLKNGLNLALEVSMHVGGAAAGYGLYQLWNISAINTPLPEMLYGTGLWSAACVSVVYGGLAAVGNRHKIYDYVTEHCCCASADQGLTSVGDQGRTVRQALQDPEAQRFIPVDPTSVNAEGVSNQT